MGALFALLLTVTVGAVSDEQVRINFREADIRSVIESVAELTGKSFVLDPRVKGKVTIIAPEAISSELLYQAFLSAIQVQGFQAVEDGVITRIVPFNQAFNVSGGGENELETRLLKINHVEAVNLVPVLKPMMSTGARLQAFAESNYLVATDTKSNVLQIVALVREMDDPSQSEVEVISLQNISAAEAVHIAGQLKQLQKQGLSLVEDGLNNRVIVNGPRIARRAFRAMLKSLDVPSARKGGVEVIRLDYSRAVDIKPIIENMLQSDMFLSLAGEVPAEGDKTAAYKVEADEANNALIVAASSAVIREVKNVVEQLDRSRPQVLIEAVIAELSEDQAKRLSVNLAYAKQGRGGYLTNFDNVLATLLGAGLNGDFSDSSSAVLPVDNVVAGAADLDRDRGVGIGVLIQALKTDGLTKVLSTPSVVTLDNEEATLSVGQEVPFVTGSYTNGNAGDANTVNPFQTINREEVGIKLKVTPQISKGDAVRLSLEQESSKLIGEILQSKDVVTSKSTITTNVLVQDGELLILGGLIDNQYNDSSAKVPLLGDIPILGHLFRSSGRSNNQRVMMMFIRPTIIRDGNVASSVSNGKFNYLKKLDLDAGEQGSITSKLDQFMEPGTPTKPPEQARQ